MHQHSSYPYLLCELANVHGGDAIHLETLIDKFSEIPSTKKGIKFQVFKPDLIALRDFAWYSVYEELFFDPTQWLSFIRKAKAHGDVWIDVFDLYSLDVVQNSIDFIYGIKLQASVLNNHEVFSRLTNLELSQKKIIVNISGYDLAEAQAALEKFSKLKATLIIQLGYQAYPTAIEDTALQKIAILKASFPGVEICMADHVDATTEASISVPVYAFLLGCSYIEKHFCLSREGSKYDHFSALEPLEMSRLCCALELAVKATVGPFISKSEREYLRKTIQIPVLRCDKGVGDMLSSSDLFYRRTSQVGIDAETLFQLQRQRKILNVPKTALSSIDREDYKDAKIGLIVAGRLKSSRLPKKALLPIGGKPSVERCLNQCLGVSGVDQVILATSSLESDDELEAFTLDGKVSVWRGHPDDVISRYLGACDKYLLDIVVRVTADCPLVLPDIAEFLLEKHFESGADYTCAKQFSVGTTVEIMNVASLRKISEHFGVAEYSEYMTWYFQNNPEYFKLNIVDLPPELIRSYRLTLDYQEDLDMFNQLFGVLPKDRVAYKAKDVFDVLDAMPEISSKNSKMPLQYRNDADLVSMLNAKTKM